MEMGQDNPVVWEFAQILAEGRNGGSWEVDYTAAQKQVWYERAKKWLDEKQYLDEESK
ncbi:hypothetical protein K3722_00465 [Leisingera caerulea]|uniref:Uncharacterized protein n=1 Tax=Leisingera caerulea TaxID=506591 RepID=A0ABY5WWF1_LEICA|nr:hypothetical protein [Leisingera caerulea]UWQ58641.1 hypothetical protein K3722_00465 [Leisingera caerulea]